MYIVTYSVKFLRIIAVFMVVSCGFVVALAQTPTPTPSPTPVPLLEVAPPTLINKSKPQEDQGDNTIKTDTDMVSLTLTVFDSDSRLVPNLKKENFKVFEEYKDEHGKKVRVEQKIESISDYDMPVGLGVLFDKSGSMDGDKIKKAKAALKILLETSHDEDSIFLVAFDEKPSLLEDLTRNNKSKVGAIAEKLMFLKAHGQTALYDAVYFGLEKVKEAESKHGKHKLALIIISDGQDNYSRYTLKELENNIKESGVIIYTVAIPPPASSDPNDPFIYQGVDFLTKIAEMTGGKVYFPTFPNSIPIGPENSRISLDETFENIALELRHQYSIGYYPTDRRKNGQHHKIIVKVIPPAGYPKLFVRSTKDGYYAPKDKNISH